MAALPCSMKAQFTAGVDALTARVADAKRPQPPNENGATARCPRFEKPEIQSALETRNVVHKTAAVPSSTVSKARLLRRRLDQEALALECGV